MISSFKLGDRLMTIANVLVMAVTPLLHGVFGADVVLDGLGKEQPLGAVQAGAMVHA